MQSVLLSLLLLVASRVCLAIRAAISVAGSTILILANWYFGQLASQLVELLGFVTQLSIPTRAPAADHVQKYVKEFRLAENGWEAGHLDLML